MEYKTSLTVEVQKLLLCNNCDIWFFSDSHHCCAWPNDMNINGDIHTVITRYNY